MPSKKSKSTNFLNRTKTFTHAQLAVFVVLFALVGALAVLQTMAAPPSKTPSYSGSLSPVMVTETSEPGVPNWNEKIKFNISTNIDRPYVRLECSQNGVVVAVNTEGYFTGALDDGIFGLSAPNWTSGAADCTAKLQYLSTKGKTTVTNVVATTTFHVNP